MNNAPWLSHYDHIPAHLDYPDMSMYEMVSLAVQKTPDLYAYEFMGRNTTYSEFLKEIIVCARSLKALGIKEQDRVTICLPNTPQAVVMLYAVNYIGAEANMIHPLSAEKEIEFYLNDSESVAAITLDMLFGKFNAIRNNTKLKHLIITSIKDKLDPIKSVLFSLTKGRKIKPVPKNSDIILWKDFLRLGKDNMQISPAAKKGGDPAVILYSGGTTGTTKGVLLSNLNFNALAMQTQAAGDCIEQGDSMLAILPIFHGFGLGVCIHTMLATSCKSILVPMFNAEIFGNLLKKKQPNFIAGVPTLFEALIRNQNMQNVDLSCLKGIFSGGDSLSVALKMKVDEFLKEHGSTEQIREGYGATECVSACCLTPKKIARKGSIGIPYPDMLFKIVNPSTQEELPYNSVGEICINGPTVMMCYTGKPEETALVLQQHSDGRTWLHTGDLGMMDEDGFVYFVQRLKRMIISSGYSIYPSHLENIIDAHPSVQMSTVIGVSDPYKIQKIKAFVVLKPDIEPTEEIKADLFEYCKKNIAKYAMPYDFEFRKSLPMTLIGKIAYRVLEAEENLKTK